MTQTTTPSIALFSRERDLELNHQLNPDSSNVRTLEVRASNPCPGSNFSLEINKSEICVCLMPTFSTFKALKPSFTADRGEDLTHFLCLHHYGGTHTRLCVSVNIRRFSELRLCAITYIVVECMINGCEVIKGEGETRCWH